MSDNEKTLHECINCEGCICEEYCRAEDEKYFSGLLTEGDDG